MLACLVTPTTMTFSIDDTCKIPKQYSNTLRPNACRVQQRSCGQSIEKQQDCLLAFGPMVIIAASCELVFRVHAIQRMYPWSISEEEVRRVITELPEITFKISFV